MGEVPLRTQMQNGERRYSVSVPQSAMGAGGWLGVRLKDPGGGQEFQGASRAEPFYALPPVSWVEAAPLGRGSVDLTSDHGTVQLKGGHRIDLDADPEDEFVLCGQLNNGKGIYAVLDRDEQGRLPEGDVAVQISHDGPYDEPIDPYQNACRLADLNNDGHLDLVLPGPNREPGAQDLTLATPFIAVMGRAALLRGRVWCGATRLCRR